MSQQFGLGRLEFLEGDRFVSELLMQLCEIGEHDVLWTSHRSRTIGLVSRGLGSGFLLLLALQSGLFLLGALSVALGATVAAQSGRTFCASSPLRPGATSNSTL